MDDNKISVRYAKALFDISDQRGILDAVRQDILTLHDVYKTNKDFVNLLESPTIKPNLKKATIQKIFEKSFNQITLDFVGLVTINKRENYLPGICRHFDKLFKKKANIKSVSITTAFKLDQDSKKQILKNIKEISTSKIELTEKINPSLIGGFILRIEDQQYDTSIAKQLKNLRKKLTGEVLEN